MIYRFIMISNEEESFMREIQIDSEATFYDFHKTILSSCGYDESQMTLFTMCENGWEMGQQVTLEEMDTNSDEDSYIMAETRLSDLLEDEKQHLIYIFDPLAERCFFIELSEIITGKSLKAPKVTRSEGKVPPQTVDFDDLLASNPIVQTISLDDEEDMFGDGVSYEDIDPEGFDISDADPYM